ncbi:MAG: hypothetical protein M1818_004824 [Claussenomyces sp. TS43310]|nr:MAG: hypothetical protein M1818_004824 [Claussenomyces sp. TS43310]
MPAIRKSTKSDNSSEECPENVRAALFECFHAATCLVPLPLRRQFVVIGGAASLAHSSTLKTEDVDVAASQQAHWAFLERVRGGARNFAIKTAGIIEYDSRQGFPVEIEILSIGGPFIDSIHATLSFRGGFVASKADLLKFRAVTVADRGKPKDLVDFK